MNHEQPGASTPEKALGARLRKLRKAAGLTQAQVAAAAGMVQSQYAHIERGRNAVASVRLPGIAKALGVSVADLVAAWDEPPTPSPESADAASWPFGDHVFSLESSRDSFPSVVRLRCRCSSAAIWHRNVDGVLGVLALRSDSSLVSAVAVHLEHEGLPAGEALRTRLQGEAFLFGLNRKPEVLWLLDHLADSEQRS